MRTEVAGLLGAGALMVLPGGTPEPAGLWGVPGTFSLPLQVSTAEVADAASYMCVAENPAGSSEKLFTLRVQGELG